MKSDFPPRLIRKQLSGFMSMNMDRHMIAQKDFFMHLVRDDGDSAEKHRDFYDEYLAVMDLTAEFYLQTIEVVFIEHSLAKSTLMHRGERIDLEAIKSVALFLYSGSHIQYIPMISNFFFNDPHFRYGYFSKM